MRRLAAAGVVLALTVVAPSAYAQDFGFRTTEVAPNVSFTCGSGVPNARNPVALGLLPPFMPGTGQSSCNWTSTAGGASLQVPATGTVTSITLPPLPNPGPMQIVVMRGVRALGLSGSYPTYACCQIRAFSQTFTVPANTPTTVPMNLPVQVDPVITVPGETQGQDLLALSVLSPDGSLPLIDLHDDFAAAVSNVYYPAPAAANGEFTPPGTLAGYVVEMSATLTPGGGGGATAGGGGAAGGGAGGGVTQPGQGLTLLPATAVGANNVAGLGQAANPPTAATQQTITATQPAARAAARKKKVVVAKGKTTVPAGKTADVRAKLTRAGSKLLQKKGKLKARLTLVATGADGKRETITKTVTLRRRR